MKIIEGGKIMQNTLLFEIGTEEIPAKFMTTALEQMRNNIENKLTENRIHFGKIGCFGTPRRIAVMVQDIAEKQSDLEKQLKGPSKKAAFDENNEATKALLGFLKSNHCSMDDIFFETVGSLDCVFVKKFEKGIESKIILETLLPELIFAINFPKSMKWKDYSIRFARPIRWLVAMFNQDIIDFSIEGLKSSNITRGHRTLSNREIVIEDVEKYIDILRDAKVMVDQNEREQRILNQIEELEKTLNCKALIEKDLLEEVVYLVEYPTAFYGSFDEEFLALPKEAIITPMKDHQRYFPVLQNEELLPNFIGVRNGDSHALQTVQKGNERVLRARLKDAQFFYNEDLKEKLESKVEQLKTIVYQVKLGTIFEKVQRIQGLSRAIGERMGLSKTELEKLNRAAYLAKADLVTGMVNEFDELQGIMGREYALKNGEEEEIAEAIFSHYLPRNSEDELPSDTFGMIISLSDKLDSIVGSFGIGVVPTGSQDPFGLRRQAIGILNILLKNGLKLSLDFMFDESIALFKDKISKDKDTLKADLEVFFKQRLKVIFNENGFRYDFVDSVMETKLENIFTLKEKLEVLESLGKTEEFKTLSVALSRVYSLSKKAEGATIKVEQFESDWEKNLHFVYTQVNNKVLTLLEDGNQTAGIEELYKLTDVIHAFFDHVMVMVEDVDVKNNRLALLKNIEIMSKRICNFDKLIVQKA